MVCRRNHLKAARSSKKRKSESAAAVKKRKEREQSKWESEVKVFDLHVKKLKHQKGQVYSRDKNEMLIKALNAYLKRRLDANKNLNYVDKTSIWWTSVDYEVPHDFGVGIKHVMWLRQTFIENGEIINKETDKRGCPVGSMNNWSTKINKDALKEIAKYVDELHSKHTTVNCTKVSEMLMDKLSLTVHKTTIHCAMEKLGLTWAPIKFKPRTFAAHRHEHLRNFLISLDRYTKEINNGNERGLVFVYTDESYIHQNNQSKCTYLSDKQRKEGIDRKKMGKGRRLVILHAITAFGPLCERDKEGFPVCDLVWHGDTPHPEKDPERLTCETLWLANSHKGNYHDNMTSEIFMKWVEQALFPTFEKLHPDKKNGPGMQQCALSS